MQITNNDIQEQDADLLERRRSPRMRASLGIKLFDAHSGKYVGGRSLDVSRTGLLLRTAYPISRKPGDLVMVGVASGPSQGVIPQVEMKPARICRMMVGESRSTLVAVEYLDNPVAHPLLSQAA